MLKEIFEQPRSIKDSMRGRLNALRGIVSLGGVKDYEQKILKAKRFKNTRNKAGYAYIVTPHGLEEKTKLALGYLQSKITEYETIRCQIVDLERELESDKTVLFSKRRTSELSDGIA